MRRAVPFQRRQQVFTEARIFPRFKDIVISLCLQIGSLHGHQ
jgi:hypothetical protein